MRALLVVIVSAGAVALLALPGRAVLAHAGEPLAPHDLWSAWNWDAPILLGLLFTGWLYLRGVQALWHSAGMGRGVTRWQAAAFAGGMLTLFMALVSPVDALGSVLFSAHMLQHLLLMMVAAPLLVLGAPPAALAWSVPRGWRVGLGRWWRRQAALKAGWQALKHPAVVWVLHALALTVWHLPPFYQAALRSDLVHFLEHASFLIAALLFWWVVARSGQPRQLGYGIGVLYIFTTAMYSGVLGALITFSRQVWYPLYASTTQAWGLTPLEDQQLAGLLMWIPANFVFLIAALLLLKAWFDALEKRELQPTLAANPDLRDQEVERL